MPAVGQQGRFESGPAKGRSTFASDVRELNMARGPRRSILAMQTSFPDLPFIHGDVTVSPIHSNASSIGRAYPKTDLRTLRAWESFPDEIHGAIQSATASAHLSSTPFHIMAFTAPESVGDEEGIRAYAKYALHRPVREVLQKLGVNGNFVSPTGGQAAVVGSPDSLWIVGDELSYPKLIVCVPATTSLLVVKPRRCTKPGARWIWRMFSLYLLELLTLSD